jgi:hypothetical protein
MREEVWQPRAKPASQGDQYLAKNRHMAKLSSARTINEVSSMRLAEIAAASHNPHAARVHACNLLVAVIVRVSVETFPIAALPGFLSRPPKSSAATLSACQYRGVYNFHRVNPKND